MYMYVCANNAEASQHANELYGECARDEVYHAASRDTYTIGPVMIICKA